MSFSPIHFLVLVFLFCVKEVPATERPRERNLLSLINQKHTLLSYWSAVIEEKSSSSLIGYTRTTHSFFSYGPNKIELLQRGPIQFSDLTIDSNGGKIVFYEDFYREKKRARPADEINQSLVSIFSLFAMGPGAFASKRYKELVKIFDLSIHSNDTQIAIILTPKKSSLIDQVALTYENKTKHPLRLELTNQDSSTTTLEVKSISKP